MIKVISAIAIISICGVVGLLVASNFKARPWQLRQLQSGLQMLETEIAYTATPLPEALAKVSQQLDNPVDKLFRESAKALTKNNDFSVFDAWLKGINKLSEASALIDKDIVILKSLGHNLGSSEREEQLKHLQMVRTQLHRHEVIAEEEKLKGERLWRYCGFLTGIIIVILIL